jgi:hypothetical protein
MNTFRHLSVALVAAAALVAGAAAHAHGGIVAKHGGIAKEADDIGYELVVKSDGVELYMEDHGEPLASAGFTGKLTVLAAGAKSEAALKPAGANRLVATGVKVGTGAKVVASLTAADGATRAVRFAVP